jgi:hypothetical protein
MTGGPCGIEASIVMIAAMAVLFAAFSRVRPRAAGRR